MSLENDCLGESHIYPVRISVNSEQVNHGLSFKSIRSTTIDKEKGSLMLHYTVCLAIFSFSLVDTHQRRWRQQAVFMKLAA